MRPLLKPALRRVWRDDTTLQIGLEPERCVVLTGLGGPARRLVESLDGTGDLTGVLARASAAGVPEEEAARLLGLLTDVLQDAAAATRPLTGVAPRTRDRLVPDLAALSLVAPEPDGGMAAFGRRRAAAVLVVGAGRIGAAVATLLAAAGLGCIALEDSEPAGGADLGPAGLGEDALGRPRDQALAEALRRGFPDVRTEVPVRRTPDVAVLSSSGPNVFQRSDQLTQHGIPHLFAEVRETTGVVGPLVLPGASSCRRCVELARSERDPAWARIVAQVATGPSSRDACDVTVATLVAAQAAGQVLSLLDAGRLQPAGRRAGGSAADSCTPRREQLPVRVPPPLPAAVNGTLESSASGMTRRRSWSPHPACGCCWSVPADPAS